MVKVTKSIVNENRNLIGFVLSGLSNDLGGFGCTTTEIPITLAELIKRKFNNSQIAVVNDKIEEKNNFKINSLPMVIYDKKNNNFIPIGNSVTITKRIVQNNENVGFEVGFDDNSKTNLRYNVLLALTKWFKPKNFVIRASATGKAYIAGKQGMPLESIPEIVIGEKPKKQAKRKKSTSIEDNGTISGHFENGIDIIDIYGTVAMMGGYVIKLAMDKYNAETIDTENVDDGEFKSLQIGEIATPKPEFNPVKINVNANFKKIGVVGVNIGGADTNVCVYVHRKKSIFLNAENHMKKFVVAVPNNYEKQLIADFGKYLALEKIEDGTLTAPLGQVINATDLVFYKVDTTKIDLISESKRKESIKSPSELVNLCKKQCKIKLLSKAVGPKVGIMKKLKDKYGADVAENKSRSLAPQFRAYSEDAIKILKEHNIDPYTGAYLFAGTNNKKSTAEGKATNKNIEIEYCLNGYDASKVTGKDVLAAVLDGKKIKIQLSQSIVDSITKINELSDPKEKYAVAEAIYKKMAEAESKLNKVLWLHNASMIINGNKARIHTHDSADWTPSTTSRVKTAVVYDCIADGCAGLTVKVKGISI